MNISGKKLKRRLTIMDRAKIIDRLKAGEPPKKLALEYNISRPAIHQILKNEENITQTIKILKEQNGDLNKKKITNIENTSFEKAMYQWFIESNDVGQSISQSALCEKAAELHKVMFGPSSDFKASNGWAHRFKKRHNISAGSPQDEEPALQTNFDDSVEFAQYFCDFLEENNYSPECVYNADETGLMWKSLPDQTTAKDYKSLTKELKSIEDRVTVMVCANASGTHKLSLFVIGKSQSPSCLKNICNLPVIYKGQNEALMDSEVFQRWYKDVFLPEIRAKHGPTRKCLLLLDNAPCHLPIDTLNGEDDTCRIIYLPVKVNSSIQPMQQGVIAQMKRAYRKQLLRAFLVDKSYKNVIDFLKEYSLKDCCGFIQKSWSSLSPGNLSRAWNRILRFQEEFHDSSQDVAEYSQIRDLLRKIPGYRDYSVNDVRLWVEEDFEDSGWGISGENETMGSEFVSEIKDLDIELSGSNDTEETTSPSEAFAAFKTLYSYAETRWDCTVQQLRTLAQIRQVIENELLENI